MASGVRRATERDPWYRRAFESLYPLIYRHRDDAAASREVAALLAMLDLAPPARVLDVACGGGRHMAAFRDEGFNVFGMDLSMTLLRDAVDERDLGGRVVSADMRTVPFDRQFDLTVNLFTSFGYFDGEAENLQALRSMAATIRPGARFVMDHMNRAQVERRGLGDDEQQIQGLRVVSRRRIDGDHVVKRMTVVDETGRTTEIIERVRMYSPSQMRAMFDAAGLDVVRVAGSFDGEPLDDGSPRMITIGVKR
jgi:SAM-dependent methyltransferase